MGGGEQRCEREASQKWWGWGYADSHFFLNKNSQVEFAGGDGRYDISGKVLPHLRAWMEENLGIDIKHQTPRRPEPPLDAVPAPLPCPNFLNFLRSRDIPHSSEPLPRLNRSHGHTAKDIWELREGQVGRVPDWVVWPRDAGEATAIVAAAAENDVVLIPYGGGTSVSNALNCPEEESRPIVSLDMCRMNRLLWVDSENLVARAEAGIVGVDLERALKGRGFTIGHEPDSIEFSTLGGWVATRASGMKKNRYGNIEDIIVHVSMATPQGLLQKSCQVPRMSAGPDIHSWMLGSEGTLGLVTEVSFKIRPLPEEKRYGSLIFRSWEEGVACLRDVARRRCAPASIRLVDNQQFRFGQALKPAAESWFASLAASLKKTYVTSWKGFDPYQMVAATLVMEGTKEEVDRQESLLKELGQAHGGLWAGAENGRYGYMLTFAIAYLRDLGFEYSCIGESFETSVPWDGVLRLCRNVKAVLGRECRAAGVELPTLASCRLTQVYDAGACIYFYFGFNYRGLAADPLHVYERMEEAAREEILASGGSISHHHGVGKLRAKFLPKTIGNLGVSGLQALKARLDPSNVFAARNLTAANKL